jgi:hypothetical protein
MTGFSTSNFRASVGLYRLLVSCESCPTSVHWTKSTSCAKLVVQYHAPGQASDRLAVVVINASASVAELGKNDLVWL